MTLSAAEQYAIELINRARLDPAAEALRYGVALNAGLSAGTISNDALYVLAPNTAAVFLVLRFSDTGIQLLHMVMSGHSILARLFGSRIFVGGLLCASCACAAAIWGMSLMAISPLILAIFAQALLDLFRYPSSLSFLYQMRAFHLGRYVRFTLIPPVVSTVLSGGLILAGHPLALYVMVAAVTLTGAVLSARDARS